MPKIKDKVKMTRKSLESIKPELEQKLRKEKSLIKLKLDKFLTEGGGKDSYIRRLDKIYQFLKERSFPGESPSSFLTSADFYKRLETFMDYDRGLFKPEAEQEKIEDFILEIVGQVFKAYYVMVILNFLEGRKNLLLPYLGNFHIEEFERYHSMANKVVRRFYGSVRLNEHFKKELSGICDNDRLEVIMELLEGTKKILKEKT